MKRRVVVKLLLVAVAFAAVGFGDAGGAVASPVNKVPISQCNTGLQYQSFPTSNNNGPDFSFRTCFLKYAGPQLYVYGAALALGKACYTRVDFGPICYQIPVYEEVTVRLWWNDTLLASCWAKGSTGSAAICYWNRIESRNIPYGANLVCAVMGYAKIAYEMYSAGSCGSRA